MSIANHMSSSTPEVSVHEMLCYDLYKKLTLVIVIDHFPKFVCSIEAQIPSTKPEG